MNERELLEARLNKINIRMKQWVTSSYIYRIDEGYQNYFGSWEKSSKFNFTNPAAWELYIEPPKEYTFMELIQRPGKYVSPTTGLNITVSAHYVTIGDDTGQMIHKNYFLKTKYIEIKD